MWNEVLLCAWITGLDNENKQCHRSCHPWDGYCIVIAPNYNYLFDRGGGRHVSLDRGLTGLICMDKMQFLWRSWVAHGPLCPLP